MMHRKPLIYAAHALLLITVTLVLLSALGFKRDGPTVKSVEYVNRVEISVDGGPWTQVTLPHHFTDLAPRTPVDLRAVIRPDHDDSVYIKTMFAPAQVFFDGQPVFTFGKRENYPAFMQDPAPELHIIETYGDGHEMTLELNCLSPAAKKDFSIYPPMVGTVKELIMERSRTLGLPMIFSLVQLVGGFTLILISLCIMVIDKKGVLFLWLGVFSLTTGARAFAENDFSSILFRDSTMLYFLSYVGYFCFMIPLLRLIRSIVDFRNPRWIQGMELLFCVSASLALLLQLGGLISCTVSDRFFHLAIPVSLITLAWLVLLEVHRYRETVTRRLVLPTLVLAGTGLLDLFNYQLPFNILFSSLFQMGILVFMLVMGVTAGLYIKDSINLRNQQKELDFERGLMDIRIKEQENRSRLIAQHEQKLSQQRHDLRHQLTAIQELASPDNAPLQAYLSQLLHNIPASPRAFCENRAVSAIVGHYDAICRQEGIRLELKLAVPAGTEAMPDSSLCIIFGNLLENAVEACCRMTEGERFIRLSSDLQFGLLTVTMDNSFDGQLRREGDHFLSSKRDACGIGLESVRSVARKAGGEADFHSEGTVFLSSVYVHL